MEKKRGIKLGRNKLNKVFKCFIHRRPRRSATVYQRLEPAAGPISKLCRWVRSGTRGGLCSGESHSVELPKGCLAVHVGDGEDGTCRVVVPVVYFNHPLFGELLREAEDVYGFNHPGRIHFPCPKSELDKVQMKIAAATGGAPWPQY